MRPTALLLLAIAACGGSAFTTDIEPFSSEGGATHDGDATDVSVPDAGANDSGGVESPGEPDAGDAPDGSTSDDVLADAPVEAACVIGQPFGCRGNGSVNERTVPPAQICECEAPCDSGDPYFPTTTPAACATCETYTCACIEAHVGVVSCSETNGQITVTY